MRSEVTVIVDGLSPMYAEEWVSAALSAADHGYAISAQVVSAVDADRPRGEPLRELRTALADLATGLDELKSHVGRQKR